MANNQLRRPFNWASCRRQKLSVLWLDKETNSWKANIVICRSRDETTPLVGFMTRKIQNRNPKNETKQIAGGISNLTYLNKMFLTVKKFQAV